MYFLADDHVNNVSYFPFMSIKKVIPYFCVLREGYYVIIWLIVRICVFIKDWKLIYSELFILKLFTWSSAKKYIAVKKYTTTDKSEK
jgi:hypothetical protein